MKRNSILHYNPHLKKRARLLRNKSTLSETLLWSKIRRKSLGYEFHRQVPIDKFIVDFYCHELKLAIEVDGYVHETRKGYDLRRQAILEALGVTFVRFENDDVNRDINGVIRKLIGVISDIEKEEKEEKDDKDDHKL